MKDLIRNHPIVVFLLICYGISWAAWFPMIGRKLEDITPAVALLSALGSYSPFLAALFVTRLSGKRGVIRIWFRSIFQFKVKASLYLFAFLFPIVLFLSSALILRIGGEDLGINWGKLPMWYTYPLFLLGVTLGGGGQEEPGWRGFLQNRLQDRYNPLTASLVVAVFWGLWHWPLFLSPTATQSNVGIGWFIALTPAVSVIYAWLFNRSRGSVIPSMLMHGGQNVPSLWIRIAGAELKLWPIVLVAWVIAAVLLIKDGSTLGKADSPPVASAGIESSEQTI